MTFKSITPQHIKVFILLTILILPILYWNFNYIDPGIVRTAEEQRNEAVEILSLAVESAAAKNRKLLVKKVLVKSGIHYSDWLIIILTMISFNYVSLQSTPATDVSECDWIEGSWTYDASIIHGEGYLKGYQTCNVDSRQDCKRNNLNAPYLGYRWKLLNPNCEAKRVPFTREIFLSTVKNKSVAFIGDSLTRNMFQSLACLLHVPGDERKMIEDDVYRYRYPDFGVTIELIVSNYLVKQTKNNCDSNATKKLADRPCLNITDVDQTWARRVNEFDILMFATGGWWEHDVQMRQVLNGERSFRAARAIMRQALVTVMTYLGRPEFEKKELYWRCSEVSHFFGGEWNSGGKCFRTAPSNYSIYNAVSLFIQEAVIDSLLHTSSNITLFDITKMSSYRQDAHPSSQTKIDGAMDCKHWCLPGVPDHWNEIWLNMLRERRRNIDNYIF